MPTAIVILPGAIPGIYEERTNDLLLARLRKLKPAPKLDDIAAAKTWLRTLPLPSGWFASAAEAKAFADQCAAERARPMTGGELREIRETLGLTREAFAEDLGFTGNSNTAHKQIYEMENGAKPIMPERALRARALFVQHFEKAT